MNPHALSALAAAERLRGRPGRVLLHSGRDDDGCGRYSFAACEPREVFEARGRQVVVRGSGGQVVRDVQTDPFEALGEWIGDAPAAPEAPAIDLSSAARGKPVPVAIGFLSYDLGRVVERLPTRARRDRSAPDMWFGKYGAVWRRDERSGDCEVVGDDPGARARLGELLAGPSPEPGPAPRLGPLVCDVSDDEYRTAVRALLDYIGAGDVYQANLARRLTATIEADGDALALYRALVQASSCAYGGIIEATGIGATRLVSGSPERFLHREPGSRRVETRPIKGTRRRTGDAAADREAAAGLATDDKERAEHLMIVDLERNDLGRVARSGTVTVDSFARVVELPTLFHVVSTVSCELADGLDNAAVVRATFPGGSITGAPKVRAMELIDELEPARRGPYTGAFGYLGRDGAMDLAIAIRTAVLGDGVLDLHVGGGIVADSTPDRELVETEEKAAAWRAAIASLADSATTRR